MATTKYNGKKAFLDYSVYAPLGAINVAFETAKSLSKKAFEAASDRRGDLVKRYEALAGRGEEIAKSVRRSSVTQRAIDQTKTARSQVKGAATSVRKAATSSVEATRSAARKVG